MYPLRKVLLSKSKSECFVGQAENPHIIAIHLSNNIFSLPFLLFIFMTPVGSKVDHKQVLMHNFLDFRHNFLARQIKICACESVWV